MKMSFSAGAEPRNNSVGWWRYLTTGILGMSILGFGIIAGAVKPVKPPPEPDPDPDPVEGVLYAALRGEWGQGPLEVWQTDANGENWVQLFTNDVEQDLYGYNQIVPSEHLYGDNNSRLFACSRTVAELNPPDADYWDVELNVAVTTSLTIVDESNNIIIDVLEGHNVALESRNSFVWYDDDKKLAFEGRKYSIVETLPYVIGVQTNWDSLGIYTVELTYENGMVSAGPPNLVQWTHDELISEPTDYYVLPYLNITEFTIEKLEAQPDRIYYSRMVDTSDPDNSPMCLYRANFNDSEFVEQVPLFESRLGGPKISPDNTILSGQNNDGIDKIIYYHIPEDFMEVFYAPDGRNEIEWSAPLWSPDSKNIIYFQGERTPSLTMRTVEWLRATKDFQDITVIYTVPKDVRGGFIGWRAAP